MRLPMMAMVTKKRKFFMMLVVVKLRSIEYRDLLSRRVVRYKKR